MNAKNVVGPIVLCLIQGIMAVPSYGASNDHGVELARKQFELPEIIGKIRTVAITADGSDIVVEYCPKARNSANARRTPAYIKRCAILRDAKPKCSPALLVDKECNPHQTLSSFQLKGAILVKNELNQGNASEERYYRLTADGIAVVNLIVGNSVKPFSDVSGNTLGTGGSTISFDLGKALMHRAAWIIVRAGDHADGSPIIVSRNTNEDYRWDGMDFVLDSSSTAQEPAR